MFQLLFIHKSVVIKGNAGYDSIILSNLDPTTNHQQESLLTPNLPTKEKTNWCQYSSQSQIQMQSITLHFVSRCNVFFISVALFQMINISDCHCGIFCFLCLYHCVHVQNTVNSDVFGYAHYVSIWSGTLIRIHHTNLLVFRTWLKIWPLEFRLF